MLCIACNYNDSEFSPITITVTGNPDFKELLTHAIGFTYGLLGTSFNCTSPMRSIGLVFSWCFKVTLEGTSTIDLVLQVCLQQNQRTVRCSSLHSAITKRSLEENEVVVGPFYLMDDQPGTEKVTFLDSDKSITIHTPSAVQEEALDKRKHSTFSDFVLFQHSTIHSNVRQFFSGEVLLAIGSGFLFVLSLLEVAALIHTRCRISREQPDRTG